jgi:MFS family permease
MSAIRSRLGDITAGLPPAYWFLWLGTVVNRLGGFVVPFLSLYLTSARGISIREVGLVVALFGAGSFAAGLVGGELTDRFGRRPVLLLSLMGAPLVTLALGFARQLPAIAAATVALGFFTDLYRPAVNAAVTDLVAPADRTRGFAYMYWAINVGAGVAPVIAGLMAHQNYFLLFAGDALTTLLYGLLVLWRFPESQSRAVGHSARVPLANRLRQLAREPVLLVFSVLGLLYGAIYQQGNVTLPLDMLAHGLGPSDYGVAISVNGILIVLTTIQVSGFIGRWPRFPAIALAALLTGLGFGWNGFARALPSYALGVAIWTLGEVISASVAPTIIADLSPPEFRGLYMGVFGSAWGLSYFVGPLVGTWAFEQFSASGLWLGCAVLGTCLAGAYMLLAGVGHRRLATGESQAEVLRPPPA